MEHRSEARTGPERNSRADIQLRVTELVRRRFGAVEESLVGSGIIDSVRAVELLILLQEEFHAQFGSATMGDLATVTQVVDLIDRSLNPAGGR